MALPPVRAPLEPPNRARDWRVAINSQPWVTSAPGLLTFNYLKVTKFLGYAVLNPATSALVASKSLGYAVLNPATAAIAASKFVGYAVLQPLPFTFKRFEAEWPVPRGRPFPTDLRTWIDPLKLNLIGQDAMTAGRGFAEPNPRQRVRDRLDWQQGLNLNLVGQAAPFAQTEWPNPGQRARDRLGWQQCINLSMVSMRDDGDLTILW